MTQPTLQIWLDRTRTLTADADDHTYSGQLKRDEINLVLQGIISSQTKCYVRNAEIQFRNKEFTYSFPSDMIEPISFSLDKINGMLILSDTWRSIAGFLNNDFNSGFVTHRTMALKTTERFAGIQTQFRDLTSDNEFIFNPRFDASVFTQGQLFEQDQLPDTMSEGDIWVDSFEDENFVWTAEESFGALTATTTIEATDRPGAGALVFTASSSGTKNITFSIVNAGAVGTTAVTKTGLGTRTSPYLYAFSVYDDNSSNDALITALGADPDITLSGADATNGTYTVFGVSDVENPALNNQVFAKVMFLVYSATLPAMPLLTDIAHPSIPTMLRTEDTIPYLVSANLIEYEEGGDSVKANLYRQKAFESINRAITHRNVRPGRQSVRPR